MTLPMTCRSFFILALAALGAQPASTVAGTFECLIEPMQTVELRAPMEGLIEKVTVDRGDAVQQGQVLIVLDTAVDRARLDLARYKAEMRGAIQAADSRLEFSSKKHKREDELFRQQVVAAVEFDESEANRNLAAAERVEALDNSQVARLEVREQEEVLRLKNIRSPLDGVVMERQHHPGEMARTDDQKPILKLARIDPLYVEVILPAALLGGVKLGDEADITPEAGLVKTIRARVSVIDPVVDAASGTFGVRLELKNPNRRIPAGTRCQVEFKNLRDEKSPVPGPKVPEPGGNASTDPRR